MRLFDPIDLRVRDLPAVESFYCRLRPLLGFTDRVEMPGWLQFEGPCDQTTAFFGITEDREHRPNRNRIAFWAHSRKRVDELAAELTHLGATAIEGPDFESESYYAVYFEDPSGNPLEICHRSTRFNG